MDKKPNVLMIVADQLRYDCLGFSGKYPVHTPSLDRLASEGVWFDKAYTHIPICCPARQSLINGRRPEAFGALWNFDQGLPVSALGPDQYAWPRQMQEAGYATGFIGKWHVNPDYDPTFYGYQDYVSLQEYEVFRREKHGEVAFTGGFMGEADPVPLADARTHWMADQAVSLIQRYAGDQGGGPWHVRVDFSEPHLPCRPSEPFASRYPPADVPQWDSFGDPLDNKPYIQRQQQLNWGVEKYEWADWSPMVARYYATISQMDDAIGRIMAYIDQQGLGENTLVIFTADHGDMCGAHGMMDKHCVMYEDILHVPLIIRGPGIGRGQVNRQLVYSLLDLPPTLAELIGFAPGEFHGRSLAPLLVGEALGGWRQEIVATYNGQQFGLYMQRMITDGRWKLVWNLTDVDELYDLEQDPAELHNLIGDARHGEQVQELRRRLYGVLRQAGDTMVTNPWLERQLLGGKKMSSRRA